MFEVLTGTIIPELIRDHSGDQPIRIWIAGCSTGEETYSLAMLFREAITAAKLNIKLQVFASDVDPDAIACAREGLYPATIEADVSPARLARFFSREDHSYRVLPELRSAVVFTVQDVLADPPFSRLDLVSCRNLLIYLLPEAQARVISLFHFSLRVGGILLLGSSESAGNVDGRFEVISKSEQLYRHIGRARSGEFGFASSAGDGMRLLVRTGQAQAPSRQAHLAELCRRLVIDTYAPAAVLINRKHECLYSLGPTDRYLRVAPGHSTHDLLAMARQDMRIRLWSAIQQASQDNVRVTIAGGRIGQSGHTVSFNIDVQPVLSEGDGLLLVCFIDDPGQTPTSGRPIKARNVAQVAELEQELKLARAELLGAIRNLEIASEEHKAINEEALSVNEEYQSTNEELVTSKEELQSLNEELTALNGQLQETLERQRTTSNDLQNVLYSTGVATIFLDTDLRIRFFTPATKSLFGVIPSDVGRPLADLNSLAADGALLGDARAVLRGHAPIEREIEARNGAWFIRRILPYRTQDNGIDGVVITFADITDRRHVADELGKAKRQAEQANIVKSRFLAAASHDLRQPLQTLALVQGLLAKTVQGESAQRLVGQLDEILGAMSGMLNTLLDINQIETGGIKGELTDFPVNDLLDRLKDEFNYHAQAKGLSLRVLPCSLSIRSDPRLLEQMFRNLLSNALKYTRQGKILVGCRRRAEILDIEVWDTGIGIPASELQTIFEEYQQLDNAARERNRGLGLGLAIVQRLGKLLNHRVDVRSWPGTGSVFTVGVVLTPGWAAVPPEAHRYAADAGKVGAHHTGTILIVEDDPEVSGLLSLALNGEGHRVATAANGIAALELVAQGAIRPDLVLADFNLPNGMNGLQVAAGLREQLRSQVPAIIVTGDISTGTLREIARQNCKQLNKPVKLNDLTQTIERLLPLQQSGVQSGVLEQGPNSPAATSNAGQPIIFIVDDDNLVREAMRAVLEEDGHSVEDYASCEAFLDAYHPGREACLLIDAYLPGMSGLNLLRQLRDVGRFLPAIMITGNSDVPMAVQAMKAGASDFIEKPISRSDLLVGVQRALELSRDSSKRLAWQEDAANHVANLTSRQRQIMDQVLAGHPSKNIAADLGISQRTVENHRAAIMKKTGSKSLPALARLALAAASKPIAQTGSPIEASQRLTGR